MTIRIEILIVWQKSIDMVIAVYRLTEAFPAEERFGLSSQMRAWLSWKPIWRSYHGSAT